MKRDECIEALVELGDFLSQFACSITNKKNTLNDKYFKEFEMQITNAVNYNGWFTKENILFALKEWSTLLTKDNLYKWMDKYPQKHKQEKTVGLIMAGNIPLVGFHDFISVLISGHKVMAKLSSNDKYFFPIIASMLEYINPKFVGKISFTNSKLDNFDAVIATGSDNTARYFEYYFKNYPSIIRKNRNSLAVLTGEETKDELEGLSEDIFRYFGLGCRSVSKIYVPRKYNFDNIFKAMYKYKNIINNVKYINNYDYNKAVYLMSDFNILENGFFMLKEDSSYSSPIATLFYQYYDDIEELKSRLIMDDSKIQCIVAKNNFGEKSVDFGETQHPKLWEYADGVDTIDFLMKI